MQLLSGAADDAWVVVKAQPEDSHSLVVPNLKSGQEYEVVVVALDGAKPPKETPSKTHIVRVGTEKGTSHVVDFHRVPGLDATVLS